MKISDEFPSKYLKAEDLQGREVRVTMANVEREELGTKNGQQQFKPVLYFKGKAKGVVLNKTNSNMIASAYGDDTEDWFGHEVILFAMMTEFGGQAKLGIRVRIPTARDNKPVPRVAPNGNGHDHPRRDDPISSGIPAPRQPGAMVTIPAKDELDDEIPF